ncbi:NIL domain-containing protein [Candidatus Omnitrophota bacterium]
MQMAIGLSFPGTLKDESVICYLCKNFNLEVVIIEASFSMSDGWAILKLLGEEQESKRALDYLVSRGIKIQEIKKEDK